jgi:hypothetical protein
MDFMLDVFAKLLYMSSQDKPLVFRRRKDGTVTIEIGNDYFTVGGLPIERDIVDALQVLAQQQGYRAGQENGKNYFDHQNGPMEIK